MGDYVREKERAVGFRLRRRERCVLFIISCISAKCEYAPRWVETGRITYGLNAKLLRSLLSNNDLLIIFLLSSTKIKQHVNQTKNIFYNLKLLDAGRNHNCC